MVREFTAMAGCTDTVRHVKESYGHPLMMPLTAGKPHAVRCWFEGQLA